MTSGGEPRRPASRLAQPGRPTTGSLSGHHLLHQGGRASCTHPHPTSDPLFVRFHQLRAIPSLPSPNTSRQPCAYQPDVGTNPSSTASQFAQRSFSTFPCVFARQARKDAFSVVKMSNKTSRPKPPPPGNEEATASLNLGEFQNVDTLTLSETALVLNALVAKRRNDRKNVNETEYAPNSLEARH